MRVIRTSIQAIVILTLIVASFVTIPKAHAAGTTFTVTTADAAIFTDSFCSLPEAILAANGTAIAECGVGSSTERDTIQFAIDPPGSHHSITLSVQLNIYEPVFIDGSSQAAYDGTPLIEITGTPSVLLWFGAAADGSIVKGLKINSTGAGTYGILFYSDNNQVIGNYFNTDGASVVGDTAWGLHIALSSGTVVGGPTAAERNIFAGRSGLLILGSSNNRVQGNYFGLAADGVTPISLASRLSAIAITAWGDGDPGNSPEIAATNVVRGNVIAGYTEGIMVQSGDSGGPDGSDAYQNTITGNYIGVAVDGVTPLANYAGISILGAHDNIIGGASAADRNVVAGNAYNILVQDYLGNLADNNLIQGNYVGTNAAGTLALNPSAIMGIGITGGSANQIVGNLVSGHLYGIQVTTDTTGTIVRGNKIGTDAAGVTAIRNTYGVDVLNATANIGDATTPGGNLISGNTGHGIKVDGTSATTIYGNLIGRNADGTAAIANYTGIEVLNGAAPAIVGNWIANSTANGVYVDWTSTVLSSTKNCFTGHVSDAVTSDNAGAPALFTGNWWGDPSGPSGSGPGTGDPVGANVDYSSFLTSVPATCLQRLTNNSFELDADKNKKPDGWTFVKFNRLTDKRDCNVRYHGTCSLKLVGNGTTKTVTQIFYPAGGVGHHFAWSLWSKASGVPMGSVYRLRVRFYSGTTLLYTSTQKFKNGTHGFRQVSGSLEAPAAYDKVVFQITFKASGGKAWFDLAELNWSP